MHIPTPEEIRAKRVALGLKQVDVAEKAGLSQSMVARIEAGTVDPRVSTLSKIVQVLNVTSKRYLTAGDIMHTPVISVLPNDTITRAAEIMESNNISQLPVIEEGVPVGCISETAIITRLGQEGLSRRHIAAMKDLMEPCFPTIPPDTDVETVVQLLQEHHAVLVIERGKVAGVITKHDLIALIR
jgi:predicted transcriptional regulator